MTADPKADRIRHRPETEALRAKRKETRIAIGIAEETAKAASTAENVAAAEAAKVAALELMTAAITGCAGLADIHTCETPYPTPPHGPGLVVDAEATVLATGYPLAREGDTILEAIGPLNRIFAGAASILIGGAYYPEEVGEEEYNGIVIRGTRAFREKVRSQLDELASKPNGRRIVVDELERQAAAGKGTTIEYGPNRAAAYDPNAAEAAGSDYSKEDGSWVITDSGEGSGTAISWDPDEEIDCKTGQYGKGTRRLELGDRARPRDDPRVPQREGKRRERTGLSRSGGASSGEERRKVDELRRRSQDDRPAALRIERRRVRDRERPAQGEGRGFPGKLVSRQRVPGGAMSDPLLDPRPELVAEDAFATLTGDVTVSPSSVVIRYRFKPRTDARMLLFDGIQTAEAGPRRLDLNLAYVSYDGATTIAARRVVPPGADEVRRRLRHRPVASSRPSGEQCVGPYPPAFPDRGVQPSLPAGIPRPVGGAASVPASPGARIHPAPRGLPDQSDS